MAIFLMTSVTVSWSAEPGSTVRNIFGPQIGINAAQCRGACGADCPDSCSKQVAYECVDSSRLRRLDTYVCGTHQGCREHDACLDACIKGSTNSGNCQSECDAKALEDFGLESSASWLTGGGPTDGKIDFEYTISAPDALEAAYRCPADSNLQCSLNSGCVTANGARVDPVFDSYAGAAANSMRISGFQSGPACGERVCEQSANIQVTGADTCDGKRCTRFGMEFDYQNADPSAPLECRTSTSNAGESDFIGNLLKLGADASVSRSSEDTKSQGEDGMAELLGMFGQVLASGDSPEDINVTITPLDKDGNPVESQSVGSAAGENTRPIPSSVDLPVTNGHLFVPMYQLADGMSSSGVKERKITCTHKGAPVLETVVRLHAG